MGRGFGEKAESAFIEDGIHLTLNAPITCAWGDSAHAGYTDAGGTTMMKRILVCTLAIVLLLSFCACGSGVPRNQQEGWGKARWIWKSETVKNNDWGAFKRTFTLESVPERAEMKIACDSKYWLYVNGELAVGEGGLRRGPNSRDTYYDVVDVAAYLQEGRNDFSLLVWYWGPGNDFMHHFDSGKGGLIVSTELVDTAGKKTVATGDGLWWAATEKAYAFGEKGTNVYLGESSIVYDARQAVEWMSMDFDPEEAGWELAQIVGNDEKDTGYAGDAPWNVLVERPIPQWKDYGLTTVGATECSVSTEKGVTRYEIPLPYNMQIYPYLELGAGTQAGAKVEAFTETYDLSELKLTYTACAGEQKYESPGWISGDLLIFTVTEGAEVMRLGYRQTGYNVESGKDTLFAGYFDGTLREDDATLSGFNGGWTWKEEEVSRYNNFYDEVWTKAAYSLYVCIRDTYMDCPDRERGQYIGDAINEIEETFYALGTQTNGLSAKAIREICAGQVRYRYQGKNYYAMSCIEPVNYIHEIPIQVLGTAVAAWNYYLFTGDETVPQDCFTAMYNYLTNYSFETSGAYTGTIIMRTEKELKEKLNTLDQWSDWGNNQDTRIAITCWWYLSAKALRSMADIEGVEVTQEQVAWLDEGLERIENNFERFWNGDLQAYATDWGEAWNNPAAKEDGTHLVDDRVNALAVVAGLVPEERYPALRLVFMGDDSQPAYENASIYMEKYVLDALCQMGYCEEAMERMAKRYLPIVNDKTSSTLPELWNEGGVSDYENYEGTKNHGWSGGPLTMLSRYVGGVAPTEPGYAAWRVLPQLGNFEEISLAVPAQIGSIVMTLSRKEGRTEMVLTSPGGKATVYVPVETGEEAAVVEGKAEYLEIRVIYGKEYAVFEITEAGQYIFQSVQKEK